MRVRGTTDAWPQRRAAALKRGIIHERGTIHRENPRKQGCAAALTVRGTIDNNDVNKTATNETPHVAVVHKKIIYVCNGRHIRYKCIMVKVGGNEIHMKYVKSR